MFLSTWIQFSFVSLWNYPKFIWLGQFGNQMNVWENLNFVTLTGPRWWLFCLTFSQVVVEKSCKHLIKGNSPYIIESFQIMNGLDNDWISRDLLSLAVTPMTTQKYHRRCIRNLKDNNNNARSKKLWSKFKRYNRNRKEFQVYLKETSRRFEEASRMFKTRRGASNGLQKS